MSSSRVSLIDPNKDKNLNALLKSVFDQEQEDEDLDSLAGESMNQSVSAILLKQFTKDDLKKKR